MTSNFYPDDQLLLPWSPRKTISTARTAVILDTSRDCVERLCQEGKLKAFKLRENTSPLRIYRDSLMAYLEDLHRAIGLEKRF